MNELIKTILGTSITVDSKSIPVAHLTYKGTSKTFITWTIISEVPGLCADDEDLYSIGKVDIDIFSDSNYLSIVREIKTKMKNNDFVWVEDSPEMYEEETGLYHKTCTFEKEVI